MSVKIFSHVQEVYEISRLLFTLYQGKDKDFKIIIFDSPWITSIFCQYKRHTQIYLYLSERIHIDDDVIVSINIFAGVYCLDSIAMFVHNDERFLLAKIWLNTSNLFISISQATVKFLLDSLVSFLWVSEWLFVFVVFCFNNECVIFPKNKDILFTMKFVKADEDEEMGADAVTVLRACADEMNEELRRYPTYLHSATGIDRYGRLVMMFSHSNMTRDSVKSYMSILGVE